LSAANVAASEDTAYHVPNVFGIGQMQLGPDGKIYFGIVNQGLGVIQNPNVPGPGCNATTSPLVVGNVLGLPSFPNYRMEPIICGDPQALDPNVRLETKLYPNPFSNRAWLEVDHDGMFPHALVLYDLNGKLLQSWPAQTEPRFEIERGDLPPGLYLYQVLRDRQIVATGKLQIE
ncbi:MAG: T9SS type A sorting domain-containing protein, partial [Bacteroidota bacterium]